MILAATLRRIRREAQAKAQVLVKLTLPAVWLAGALCVPAAARAQEAPVQAARQDAARTPHLNFPYFSGDLDLGRGGITWFGQVSPDTSYGDVRFGYAQDRMLVIVHVIDRLVWYDPSPVGHDLTQYDGASLYLQAGPGQALDASSYQFQAQVNWNEARTNWQRAYRFESGSWQPASIAWSSRSGYRANPNDNEDDKGYLVGFEVPFAALGLSAAPTPGTVWRMALVLHNRNSQAGPPQPDQAWPGGADLNQPTTWGEVEFSLPAYTAAPAYQLQTVTVKNDAGGVSAPDAAVGGFSDCAAKVAPNYFEGFGTANYAGAKQFNIQNQWDVADFPCFSKYLTTFPLTAVPQGSSIVSATVEMHLFGNAGYEVGQAKPSWIQVARLAGDWDVNTVNWNNAPPLLENYGNIEVKPVDFFGNVTYSWDVSRAVADALAAGEPLRLAFYSTDGEMHSGKYFWSAYAEAYLRPMLSITWGKAGYSLTASPQAQKIQPGQTVSIKVDISANAEGSPVNVDVGSVTPAGLNVSVSPKQVPASGGQVVITVTDTHPAGFKDGIIYMIPIQTSAGSSIVQNTQVMVQLNGASLYLPKLAR